MDAEKATGALISVIEHLGGTIDILDAVRVGSGTYPNNTDKGVYFFFHVTQTNPMRVVCVYCGCTGRTFAERFVAHKNNGIIKTWFNPGLITKVFPVRPNGGKIGVGLIRTSGPIAKLLEGILLEKVDFPLNAQENGTTRPVKILKDSLLENPETADIDIINHVYHALESAKDDIRNIFHTLKNNLGKG